VTKGVPGAASASRRCSVLEIAAYSRAHHQIRYLRLPMLPAQLTSFSPRREGRQIGSSRGELVSHRWRRLPSPSSCVQGSGMRDCGLEMPEAARPFRAVGSSGAGVIPIMRTDVIWHAVRLRGSQVQTSLETILEACPQGTAECRARAGLPYWPCCLARARLRFPLCVVHEADQQVSSMQQQWRRPQRSFLFIYCGDSKDGRCYWSNAPRSGPRTQYLDYGAATVR